jgi:hypothetical protein
VKGEKSYHVHRDCNGNLPTAGMAFDGGRYSQNG